MTVRLQGGVRADPATGRLTAVFDDNPPLPFNALDIAFDDNLPLPFNALDIAFDGGPGAVIAAPQRCGAATGAVTYGPWSGGVAVTAPAAVAVTGCAGPAFAPGFSVATSAARAGGSGAFTASFSRPDGQEFLSGVRVTLPPGCSRR